MTVVGTCTIHTYLDRTESWIPDDVGVSCSSSPSACAAEQTCNSMPTAHSSDLGWPQDQQVLVHVTLTLWDHTYCTPSCIHHWAHRAGCTMHSQCPITPELTTDKALTITSTWLPPTTYNSHVLSIENPIHSAAIIPQGVPSWTSLVWPGQIISSSIVQALVQYRKGSGSHTYYYRGL